MSFLFSFSGDDIEEENGPSQTKDVPTSTSAPDSLATRLQNTTLATPPPPPLFPPKRHTLAELLTSLPSQISYNYLTIPPRGHPDKSVQPSNATGQNGTASDHHHHHHRHHDGGGGDGVRSKTRVARRSLFDIRQQLMAESDPEATGDETGNLLAGLETGDLSSGVYEGGYKTWECAVDLGGFVAGAGLLHGDDSLAEEEGETETETETEGGVRHVIELGAGSAVPSLVLLVRLLERRRKRGGQEKHGPRVRFTLCDYNEDVLRLGTAVNVFLATALSLPQAGTGAGVGASLEDDDEGDMEIDDELVQQVLSSLQAANVEVDFISGAWGADFVRLARGEDAKDDTKLLLLASETIYSPDSLHAFSRTVLDILKLSKRKKTALIAAKKVYFGVGGGVREFEEVIKKLGGSSKVVLDVKSAGVGRVVLEVLGN